MRTLLAQGEPGWSRVQARRVDPSAVELRGQLLGGKYRVLEPIGEGGAGTVYEAMHEDLGRKVAVKVLHATHRLALARLKREALTTAALGHPNIVQITDFQVNAGQPSFIVMERLVGTALHDRIKEEGRLAPEVVAVIGVQVLSALAAAHDSGVLHRDVKPSNILVCPTPALPHFVKLLDFGLAKLTVAESALTRPGAVIGTPSYMSPEQVHGLELDARSDVFSVGATMYHALTGTKPFPGEDRERIMAAIGRDEARPMPDVDPALAALVMRALAKDRRDRFASARELGAALSQWLEARAPSAATRAALAATRVEPLRATPPNEIGPLPEPGEQVLGRFTIARVIGRGGMGIVYEAHHEVLGVPVALKLLTHRGDASSAERFVNEARLAERVRGRHVCRVYDAGRLPSGHPYIAMELLEGMDLAEILHRAAPLPIGLAVEYVLQSLEGLAACHAAKIVHRDLKPSNLFLTRDSAGRAVIKILDFGLSKVEDPASPSLTNSMAILGSPTYMAPEQIRNAREVDVRADVWAMGVILFELLSARLPFEGDTPGEVFARVFQRRMTALSTDVPEGLRAIVMKCLEADPAARFASAEELARALEPFREPGAALRGAPEDVSIAPRRARWPLAALAGAAAIAAIAVCRAAPAPEPIGPTAATTEAATAVAAEVVAAQAAAPDAEAPRPSLAAHKPSRRAAPPPPKRVVPAPSNDGPIPAYGSRQ